MYATPTSDTFHRGAGVDEAQNYSKFMEAPTTAPPPPPATSTGAAVNALVASGVKMWLAMRRRCPGKPRLFCDVHEEHSVIVWIAFLSIVVIQCTPNAPHSQLIRNAFYSCVSLSTNCSPTSYILPCCPPTQSLEPKLLEHMLRVGVKQNTVVRVYWFHIRVRQFPKRAHGTMRKTEPMCGVDGCVRMVA